MPRPARPWFRFYTEAIHDRKLRRLTPAQRWLWVAVLAAARESCRPGYLMVSEFHGYDNADLADYAGMTRKEVSDGAVLLEQFGMLAYDPDLKAWYVTHWKERQFESDDTTVRTAKHRSQKADRNVPTPFVGTPPETEGNKNKKRSQPREDFATTESHAQFCLEHGLALETERAHWLEWCEAHGKTFVSQNAGFATWLRQAVAFGRGGRPVVTLEELAQPVPSLVREPWVCPLGNPECVSGWVDLWSESERRSVVVECACRVKTIVG